ncbi:MAG: cobaltochelatase subunit CobN [Paracoccaceae bacterium]|nr:cobaltochelatase subunit CobN [Paracoccaceae bacterium]
MHVIFRENHGLEESEAPRDLGQSPADLVVMSFSDSDLGAFAAGWHRADGKLSTLRLANLSALKHPLSVDTYIEQTLEHAQGIMIRIIGGVPYWAYGLEQVYELAKQRGIALAVLPADGRPDERLDAFSTLPVSTLRRLANLCDQGGDVAAQAALAQLSLAAGLYAGPVKGAKTLPEYGAWTDAQGTLQSLDAFERDLTKPLVLITFYRSYLSAADIEPLKALSKAFGERGILTLGLFAPSLKSPTARVWLETTISNLDAAAIINLTAFSGRGADNASPLDAGNVPVFQAALATSDKDSWANSDRGLSPADLAMHVVLPEVDGRLFAGVVSFKEATQKNQALEYARTIHAPDKERVDAIADKALAWIKLAQKPNHDKKLAIILSTYPGKDWQMAHAVGLDALASVEAIAGDLRADGYLLGDFDAPISDEMQRSSLGVPLEDYHASLNALPEELREDLNESWGAPEDDPSFSNGAFHFSAVQSKNILIALQPERGQLAKRDDDYHDLSRTPCHAYVAFYLFLRSGFRSDALVHVGAHGTLEWLPGKSVALSNTCWPEALISSLPVIYPFIVNDPGEAAQAKRRIGAVTLGHIPPALKDSKTPERMSGLESLLDEFSNADGLDPKRRDRLQSDIRDQAKALGVEGDLGISDDISTAEAITRIDRFVCDIKESQFGDGLHIWGRLPPEAGSFDPTQSVAGEKQALLDALNGKRIESGPSGSPYRRQEDVLPTGRNLFTTDPRSVPTRSAYAQGVRLAEELVRRHLQEEGDYPKGLIVDLWGSATMRTAGEEFAMALHLLGAKPVWDQGSERVSGVEIIPIAELARPRIDVTLRVSGLFRDVFPSLSTLFSQAVEALSKRDEASDWNPFAGKNTGFRVFGPAPGHYGLAMGGAIDDYSDEGRSNAGTAWLNASSWGTDGKEITKDLAGITERVEDADSFVHLQDLSETDILLAEDYAAHEAGFAAAKTQTGGKFSLYHLDNTDISNPTARTLQEEIARVVHARATNSAWINGMKRHGFRGAAEIAATLDHLGAFANLAGVVGPHLFDAYHDATLGNAEVVAFMQDTNPKALQAMKDRFNALHSSGLWETRRNSIISDLERLG